MIFQDYTFANVSFLWALTIIPFLAAWLFWRPQQKQSVLQMGKSINHNIQRKCKTFWNHIMTLQMKGAQFKTSKAKRNDGKENIPNSGV